MKNTFRIVLNIDNVGYEYGSESIQSINIEQSLGSDITKPSYGITSQAASISLIDKDKSIFYILNTNSNAVMYVDIYLNDSLTAHYISDNISYKYSNSVTTISLGDDLMKLQKPKTKIYTLGGKKEQIVADSIVVSGELCPLSVLIQSLFEDTQKIIGSDYILQIDDFTQNIIDNIQLYYGFLDRDTYWNNWNKIAQCGLFNIYLKEKKFVIRRII